VVVRGDTDTLTIGEGSNIQDGSVVHTDVGLPLVVGKHVTVGHQVILHGCQIGDETLIGMGAVILNGARIGKHCIVGAGSLVTEGKDFPDGSLIMGSPAKVVRQVRSEEIEKIRASAAHYVKNAQRHRQGLKPLVG
jgi:carbonic anhydrase/acetyltransferase-like protein (isoleucine patch superfamily)